MVLLISVPMWGRVLHFKNECMNKVSMCTSFPNCLMILVLTYTSFNGFNGSFESPKPRSL